MAYVTQEGPYQYGGAAITSMVDIQGIKQIKNFICHIRTPGDAGDLLHIAYRWANWFKSLQDYLKKLQATIEINIDPVYPLQRVGDEHLMPKIIQSKWFSEKEINRINYYCMYLNVTMIPDVKLANRKTLNRHMLHGTISLMSSTAKQMPINQHQPGEIGWMLWRKAMSSWALDNTLKCPL
eukprot:4096445-Ditylum_brightwellii.AAC.1